MKKKSFHCHCTTPPRRTPERQAWGRRSSRRRNPRPFLPCSRSRAPSSGARGMTNLDLLEVFDMDDARLGSRPPWSSLPSPPPPPILHTGASAWWCVPPLFKRVSQDILFLATFPLFPFSLHSVILFGHPREIYCFGVLANPRFRRSERSAFGIISRCKRSCRA